jgi:hypothetical protein
MYAVMLTTNTVAEIVNAAHRNNQFRLNLLLPSTGLSMISMRSILPSHGLYNRHQRAALDVRGNSIPSFHSTIPFHRSIPLNKDTPFRRRHATARH